MTVKYRGIAGSEKGHKTLTMPCLEMMFLGPRRHLVFIAVCFSSHRAAHIYLCVSVVRSDSSRYLLTIILLCLCLSLILSVTSSARKRRPSARLLLLSPSRPIRLLLARPRAREQPIRNQPNPRPLLRPPWANPLRPWWTAH